MSTQRLGPLTMAALVVVLVTPLAGLIVSRDANNSLRKKRHRHNP